MNQIYKKKEFIIIPVQNNFIIINTEKVFNEGHTHVKSIGVARLLIDLSIEKRLPNNPHFVDKLIRINVDKDYMKKLEEFKQEESIDIKKLMSAPVYRRYKGAIRQVK